jgi:hypothetical protein
LFLLRFIFKNPAISAHFARSRQSPVHHTWIRQILARFTARVLLRPEQVKLMSTGEDFVNTLRRTQQEDAGLESKQYRKTKPPRYSMRNRQQKGLFTECGNCGMVHDERNCPAFGKKCFKCEKMNHFARKCRGKNSKASQVNQSTEVEQKPEEDLYCISSISDSDEPKARKAVINLQVSKPDAENTVQFQIDTGSQCDILPASSYIQVTGVKNNCNA